MTSLAKRAAASATAFAIAVTAFAFVPHAHAQTMDGHLDLSYGVPIALQATQTPIGDNQLDRHDYADGSELDALYGLWLPGYVYVFLTGNLACWIQPTLPAPLFDQLELFIDSKPGGQNVLLANNAAVNELPAMAGLKFDAGFEPDYWISARAPGGSLAPYTIDVYMASLPTGGNGTGAYLGSTGWGTNGFLTGGSNPGNVHLSIDNSNLAGVGGGCAPQSGAGAEWGIEIAIPPAAMGAPDVGCARIMAFVDGDHHAGACNQVLPPLPAGTCLVTAASGVDFSGFAGDQFATVCGHSLPATISSWGAVKSTYR